MRNNCAGSPHSTPSRRPAPPCSSRAIRRRRTRPRGRATRGGGAIAGAVDIITEFRRYDPTDSANRLRLLTGFSRFEETPAELVLELTSEGEYRAVGTRAEVRAARRNDEMLARLGDDWTTPEAIHEAWPTGDAPSVKTIKRRLAALVTSQHRQGR